MSYEKLFWTKEKVSLLESCHHFKGVLIERGQLHTTIISCSLSLLESCRHFKGVLLERYPQYTTNFLAAGVFMTLTLCVRCRDMNRLSQLPEEASSEVESASFGSMTSYVRDTRSPF